MVRHAPIHRRSGHSDIAICCGRNVRGSSPSTSVVPLSNQVTTLNHKRFKGFKMFSDGHLDIRKAEDIAPSFDAATRQHAGALLVSVDALTQENRRLITELAANHRLPAIYVSKEYIDIGGLIAYGPSYPDLYRRAAIYVDK